MTSERNGSERRKSLRVPVPGAHIEVQVVDDADRHFVAEGVDLNATGLGLKLPQDILTGTLLSLSFELEGGSRTTAIIARVVYNSPAQAGVEFVTIDEKSRLDLLAYLANCSR